MGLLVPLVATIAIIRVLTRLMAGRGHTLLRQWDSWPAACAAGMSAVFVLTGIRHFVEPGRSGLIAIVPTWVPQPALAVTATGIIEFALALLLLIPSMRRYAAVASIALLIALFPANVVAAQGVDHASAPSTHLLPRMILQALFVIVCGLAVYTTPPVRQ